VVYIPRALLDEMIEHALAGRPNEACGILAGEGQLGVRFYPARNVEESPVRYLMDPREQLKIMEEIDRHNWDILGIFHSHTRSPAYPSSTDVKLASYPQAVYLIASLADDANPEVRAFYIENGLIREESIEEPPGEEPSPEPSGEGSTQGSLDQGPIQEPLKQEPTREPPG
jgi:[CysO sulfur-carrier protein]-S-L-cysteine hydrolase